MHRRTKALAISPKVKKIVYERDEGRCVICGKLGNPEAHYISRSQGGLGIEQNIVTLCRDCHRKYDNTIDRPIYKERIKAYLQSKYEDWNEDELIYRKEH